MDLKGMLIASGVGCGPNCRCVAVLVETLSPLQERVFAHLLEHGAEVRRDAVIKASAAESPPSFMDMMMKIFGEVAAEDEQKDGVEPYEGELGVELDAAIASFPEEDRQEIEVFIREFITKSADGDPNRVLFRRGTNGNFGLRVEKERDALNDVEPYVGELGTELDAAIASILEEFRDEEELGVRKMITKFANGDPSLIFAVVTPEGTGFGLKSADETIANGVGEQAASDNQDEAA